MGSIFGRKNKTGEGPTAPIPATQAESARIPPAQAEALRGLFKRAFSRQDSRQGQIASLAEELGRGACRPFLPFEIACLKVNLVSLEAWASHNINLQDAHGLAIRTLEALEEHWIEPLLPGMKKLDSWKKWEKADLLEFQNAFTGGVADPERSMALGVHLTSSLEFVCQQVGPPSADLRSFRTHLLMYLVTRALGEDRPDVMQNSPLVHQIFDLFGEIVGDELTAYLRADLIPAVDPDQDEAMAIIDRLRREAN